jgi:hypothetical protein
MTSLNLSYSPRLFLRPNVTRRRCQIRNNRHLEMTQGGFAARIGPEQSPFGAASRVVPSQPLWPRVWACLGQQSLVPKILRQHSPPRPRLGRSALKKLGIRSSGYLFEMRSDRNSFKNEHYSSVTGFSRTWHLRAWCGSDDFLGRTRSDSSGGKSCSLSGHGYVVEQQLFWGQCPNAVRLTHLW